MARSRSSFELTSAIAAASTLAREEKKPGAPVTDAEQYRGLALVSFQPGEAPTAMPAPTRPAPEVPRADRETQRALAIPPPPPSPPSSEPVGESAEARQGPRLPDLSNVVSPIVRCEKVIEWIAAATHGTGVFIADADGLPVAGDIHDAEARIGASGLVASSIATLLSALPGQPSPLFEVHIGEGDGPFFQLIGFSAARGTFVVGLTRHEPLSPRQAHAIRLACRHAFGEPLTSVAPGSTQ